MEENIFTKCKRWLPAFEVSCEASRMLRKIHIARRVQHFCFFWEYFEWNEYHCIGSFVYCKIPLYHVQLVYLDYHFFFSKAWDLCKLCLESWENRRKDYFFLNNRSYQSKEQVLVRDYPESLLGSSCHVLSSDMRQTRLKAWLYLLELALPLISAAFTCRTKIERWSFTFQPNGRRELVPHDQVFPLHDLTSRFLFIASTLK